MTSYDIYCIHYFSLVSLLNKLDVLHVEVKKYVVCDNENFYIKINRKYRKIIKDNFRDYKIVDKIGLLNAVEKLVSRPITLVSFLLSVCLFVNLSNRVYSVEVEGDYPLIEESIVTFLKQNNIDKYRYGLSDKDISDMERLLKAEFNDELEFLELRKSGAKVYLKYKKRRKTLVITDKKGALYASKDGVIKGFLVQSGVKNVKVYDFVKKGDLLISDILITENNENINIGTIAKVFASTFYYIEVRCDKDIDLASKQAYMLDQARYEVSKNINSDDEYIESENILINNPQDGYMKIYYVLYEDITI